MATLRVSVVQYLNSVPLVWGMLHGEQQGKFDLEFTTPALCAEAIRQRKADVGIIPSIEYQRMDRTQVLSGLSIASKDEVKSVLLLSKVPIDKVQSVAGEGDHIRRRSFSRLRMDGQAGSRAQSCR